MLIYTQITLCSNSCLYFSILFHNDFLRIYLLHIMKPFDCLVLLTLPFTRRVKGRTIHKTYSKAVHLRGLPYSTQSVSPSSSWTWDLQFRFFTDNNNRSTSARLMRLWVLLLPAGMTAQPLRQWIAEIQNTVSTWEWTHSIFVFSFPSKRF